MKYLVPAMLGSLLMVIASNAVADPCTDAICSLAGHIGSSLGAGGILGLLAAGSVVLGVWLYRRRDRVDDRAVPERTHSVKV